MHVVSSIFNTWNDLSHISQGLIVVITRDLSKEDDWGTWVSEKLSICAKIRGPIEDET
jgi:LEA14-like dessication related protein